MPNADLTRYRNRPIALLWRYAMMHKLGHITVLVSVVLAVFAAVSTQYGLRR